MRSHRIQISPSQQRRQWAARGLAGLFLAVLGLAIGSRLASPDAATTVTVLTPAASTSANPAGRPGARKGGFARTSRGAAAAAAACVSALDGTALLDRVRLRALVASLASVRTRARLTAAYERAALDARSRLGLDSVPAPIVFVRAIPVGYRVDEFNKQAATVSVWRLGIVGSGATVQPQQSWRTVIVSLVWERAGWKVAGFASEPGPTPPLGATAPSTATDLFASVPRFKEFSSANP